MILPCGRGIRVVSVAASLLGFLPERSTAAAVAIAFVSPVDTIAFSFPGDSLPRRDSVEWIAFVPPNGEDEHYLRALQVAGLVQRYPWSVRGFSMRESRQLAARVGTHPWSGSAPFTPRSRFLGLRPATAAIWYNAAFPYGSNDGPVWAGRGVTGSVEAGAHASVGPVSLVLAPVAFQTQNSSFTLMDNGLSDNLVFADGQFGTAIDRPQRFGDRAYRRADPGNSTVRADIAFGAAGVSTANMVWGPFDQHPFVLGTNAPGFAHAFIGTARPVSLWFARVHGRVVWGRLDQSGYSPVEGEATFFSIGEPGTRRFASGLVATVEPRGVPGLELGVARFFHSVWPRTGIPRAYFRKPLEGFFKREISGTPGFPDVSEGENQLISGFARWLLPAARLEVYAEYGREDHSYDKRDFLQEPDHSRSYGLGLRHVFRPRPTRVDAFVIELINFQLPHLARTLRGEGGIYVHGIMRQGHTNRGQLLGADVGIGTGAGVTMRWDRYVPAGRTSVALNRIVRMERGNFFTGGPVDPRAIDVQYALQGEKLRRLGRSDVTLGATLIREFNRDFADDAWSMSLNAKVRLHLSR
jgi:hypothetical protein